MTTTIVLMLLQLLHDATRAFKRIREGLQRILVQRIVTLDISTRSWGSATLELTMIFADDAWVLASCDCPTTTSPHTSLADHNSSRGRDYNPCWQGGSGSVQASHRWCVVWVFNSGFCQQWRFFSCWWRFHTWTKHHGLSTYNHSFAESKSLSSVAPISRIYGHSYVHSYDSYVKD